MNRKNPGLTEEPKPITQEEEIQFIRYSALGWTIAAFLYTAFAFWKGSHHTQETALLVWLMAALSWGFWLYEQRKAKRHTLSK